MCMLSSRTFGAYAGLLLLACRAPTPKVIDSPPAPRWTTTPSGMQVAVVDSGTGPAARAGQTVLIHEIMRHMDGTVIFDSYAANSPVPFTLGANQVIDAIDEAVSGMRVGARWLLIVPPALSKRDVPCPTCDTGSAPRFKPTDSLRYDVLLVRTRDPATP